MTTPTAMDAATAAARQYLAQLAKRPNMGADSTIYPWLAAEFAGEDNLLNQAFSLTVAEQGGLWLHTVQDEEGDDAEAYIITGQALMVATHANNIREAVATDNAQPIS